MTLRLYNTLTRTIEPFAPLAPGRASVYVCGPTVYDDPHLGHLRSAYVFDVLRRHLKSSGFAVTFVRNVTDVDDKIIERARKEPGASTDLNAACREVSSRYLTKYHGAINKLGILPPDIEPRATDHVTSDNTSFHSMINFIAELSAKGAAYEAAGDVYFSVRKFPPYGQLSKRSIDELQTGARIEPGEHKQDPLDFALWKSAKPGEPSWQSPWGPGRPGWHIECSVMSTKYLTDQFDIHGGGIDLIFPHHENEIAQAQALGKKFANYWVHHGLVTVNGEKMSKSLGNFITLEQALEDCGGQPDALKIFFLGTHYRNPLNYMKAALTASRQRYDNYRLLIDHARNSLVGGAKIEQFVIPVREAQAFEEAFIDALDDDLNTPQAISALDGMRKLGLQFWDNLNQKQNQAGESKEKFLSVVRSLIQHGQWLGLFEKLEDTQLTQQINTLFERYKAARGSKDFKTSDALRKELGGQGFIVQDTGGTSFLIPKR